MLGSLRPSSFFTHSHTHKTQAQHILLHIFVFDRQLSVSKMAQQQRQKAQSRREPLPNVPRSPRPTSMSPSPRTRRRPHFGSLEIHTIEKIAEADAADDEEQTEAAAGATSVPKSPRQHPPKSPKSKPYRARGSRGRGGRRRRAAQKQAAAAAAAADGTDTTNASVDAMASDVSAVSVQGSRQQQDKRQQQQEDEAQASSSEISDPPQIQRKMSASVAARSWTSTIDRPMETIEILTNGLQEGLCPIRDNSTDDTSIIVPGLQRLRSFSSELSVATLDSPRRSAAAACASEYITEPIMEEDQHDASPSVPQMSDDLKGLALIDEDNVIARSDTHITTMSTASTKFTATESAVYSTTTASASVASSTYIRQVPSDADEGLRSRSSSTEYSTNSTMAILNGYPGVLPPPMTMQQKEHSLQHHHQRQQYESRFLAGAGGEEEYGGDILYSCSDESSIQSNNGYFVRGDSNPQISPSHRSSSVGLSPPNMRGRTFTDPTNTAMGYAPPAPIPFSVEQMEQAAFASLNEQKYHMQQQQHHRHAQQVHQQQHMHHQQYTGMDQKQAATDVNRNRTFSDPTGGRGQRQQQQQRESQDEPSISQDDSGSLFNISPKSFLMGNKSSFDKEEGV